MLVQPFIENAIKHGMSNKSGKGNISIDYKISNELIKCVVTDDGIGREKAGELTKDISKHKSLGVQLTEERLEILNKQGKSNITFKITDLRDDTGIACGTKVELNIPFETDE
jgi:LytS/YehU family sensor histidine kinase